MKADRRAWETCDHHFQLWFGPIMLCTKCGAETIASMDGQSKPIYAPHNTEPKPKEGWPCPGT